MKTIRLLFLFAWALAQTSPKASAQNFQLSAGSISFPVLTVSAADAGSERDGAATYLTIRSASFADRLVELSHQATDTWRQFVHEWLANREKMWIWMFLLLLLLARL